MQAAWPGDEAVLDERAAFGYTPGMSKAAKVASNSAEAPAFEEALKQLESIVEAMESGDLPLETMLTRFEEGMKLARHCQSKLEEAGQRIQQLEKTASGEFGLKPLPEPKTAE